MPIVCFGLGTWQVNRLKWKVSLIDDLEDKLSREPMVLPRNINLFEIPNFEYRRVRVSGVWDNAHSILLGPRTHENVLGYHIITPLIRGDHSSTILVDRGFVSKDLLGNNPTIRQRLLSGVGKENEVVELVGLLRQGQLKGQFTPDNNPEKGEWYWSDVNALATHAGGSEAGVQPVLIEALFYRSSGDASRMLAEGIPIGRSPNIELRNMHATYAITWYSLSVATAVMFWYLVRTLRRRRGAEIDKLFSRHDARFQASKSN
ncbi:SURF1 family-domain-containing protein [Cantharellus anzutake]|uniref:SURF1 family-domain-containing protein n=1 Tax=Cantharellus anzutake TaxID=1750568 RepID=UPI0019074773|nr:SURF1 family-domain-containing protein [Cantharellus anzutake]KAF8329119.1 SURF1 family-domain-containing protein [Cantharellus anzutake]